MRIIDRYATAIHASNLRPDDASTAADLDILGAAGLAAKYEPLGMALARMLSGGGRGQVLDVMADEAFSKSFSLRVRVSRPQAADIAKAVLAWFMHGVCLPCGGTGFARIKDTPSLGDECPHCKGTGKLPFDKQFRQDWRPLAQWLKDEIERSQANAGVIAMKKLAPKLDM